jgi:N6-L-threonylcarbamoyladenine synthase
MKKNIKILAIESSCDETAASVVGEKNGRLTILSSIVSSQIDLHAKTSGVVPEVASRAHMEAIIPVVAEALLSTRGNLSEIDYQEAVSILKNEIDYIAVTAGPGLIGSLLVGYNAAKTIAYSLDKPIIPINHIEGHIYSVFSGENQNEIKFPILSLTVSGGHTSMTLMRDHGEYENIGATLDDAAGEAFDKVARLLELGYPGGPIVSKLAAEFREKGKDAAIIFPRPILSNGTFNFSFSGLKTAVLQCALNIKKERELTPEDKIEICAAFEDAVVDVLTTKTIRAAKKYEPKTVILAGGVAANSFLRKELEFHISELEFETKFIPAPMKLCGDNAAMIGLAAYYHILKNNVSAWDKIKVDSNVEL